MMGTDCVRALLAIGFLLVANNAYANQICKAPERNTLSRIDIFDGRPEELVILAPSRSGDRWGTWDLAYVYDAGRTVTVRCTYADGSREDVTLAKRTRECRYREGGRPAISLRCS